MEWPFVRRFKLDAVLTVNQVYLDEINRLNQELANELNSHRETKKQNQQRLDAYNTLNHKYRCLVKELEETKDALRIAQEDLMQNQMELFSSDLRANKAKEEMSKVRGYLKTIAKKL